MQLRVISLEKGRLGYKLIIILYERKGEGEEDIAQFSLRAITVTDEYAEGKERP